MKLKTLLLALLLPACSPEATMPMQTHSDSPRISVTRIGVIADELAYGARRGVYLIKDMETGREFIGVSGVGISETGSHQTGKTSTTDER